MTTISSKSAATNTSRMSGLASGLDIDTMVSDMMKVANIPVDKLNQAKQILEWQQEDYRTINSTLYDFKNNVFNAKLEATFNTKSVTSSNSAVASVTAGVNAVEGTYTIKVNNLASGVSTGSSAQLTNEKDGDGNTLNLFDQFTELGDRGLISTDNISVNINGTALEFDLDVDNINTVVAKINDANLGIKASYDTTYKRFFLATTNTGSAANLTVTSDTANFISNSSDTSILKLSLDEGVSRQGQDASLDIGDATNLQSASNNITVNGFSINLKDRGESTILVTRDIDSVVNSIKGLVNSYNETINKLYSKVHETRNRDFLPLTGEQKKSMSETDIKNWEVKARSGLIRDDGILDNFIGDLRRSMSKMVTGVMGQYTSLSQIGITTQSYTDNGKLYIDENKLREALTKDPDGVKSLFTHNSMVDNEKGIAMKLYDVVSNGVSLISAKAGSTSSFSTVDNSYIGQRLKDMNKEIKEWETKLTATQAKYYANFTTMETAINKMNTQSSWLSQQLGSSGSSA